MSFTIIVGDEQLKNNFRHLADIAGGKTEQNFSVVTDLQKMIESLQRKQEMRAQKRKEKDTALKVNRSKGSKQQQVNKKKVAKKQLEKK